MTSPQLRETWKTVYPPLLGSSQGGIAPCPKELHPTLAPPTPRGSSMQRCSALSSTAPSFRYSAWTLWILFGHLLTFTSYFVIFVGVSWCGGEGTLLPPLSLRGLRLRHQEGVSLQCSHRLRPPLCSRGRPGPLAQPDPLPWVWRFFSCSLAELWQAAVTICIYKYRHIYIFIFCAVYLICQSQNQDRCKYS